MRFLKRKLTNPNKEVKICRDYLSKTIYTTKNICCLSLKTLITAIKTSKTLLSNHWMNLPLSHSSRSRMYSLVHSFMLLTILMVLVSFSNASNAPSKLIQDICKETAESQGTYDGCVGALELDPTADSADISRYQQISANSLKSVSS